MQGVVFPGDRTVAFVEFPDPSPGPGQVVVEIKASGMCGSDLHVYRAPARPGVDPGRLRIGGHEPCGVVAAVGPGVPESVARPGDRVMVHHYEGCGVCAQCRTGWAQLCRVGRLKVYGGNAHGAHAPYLLAAASTLVPLREELGFAAGAAISCGTGTAWGALERVGMSGRETIAVFGQGPVGLSVTMLAAARGARVIALDVDAHRLELARSFGADATVDPSATDVPEAVAALTAGRGVQIAIETSGASVAASAALASLAVWGRLCLVGLGSTLELDVAANLSRQVTVMTSWTMSSIAQQDCADFVVERGLDVDRLFTHTWTLDQAEQAYATFDRQAAGKGVFLR